MASLTGGGLEIQTSIPNYNCSTGGTQSITLIKHQVCSITLNSTTRSKFNFSGTCIIIYPKSGVSSNNNENLYTTSGTSTPYISKEYDDRPNTVITVMRII